MRINLTKVMLILCLILLVGCGSVADDDAASPVPTAQEVVATEVVADDDAASPVLTGQEVEVVATEVVVEEKVVAEETRIPQPTPTLRAIASSGPISDLGDQLDEYMGEGLFISHFDSTDIDLWYGYSQSTEVTLSESETPPDGYISSSTWHAKQTNKWVQPTDGLEWQADQMISGDGAARWSDTMVSTRLTIIDIPHDWSGHMFLSFWAHSAVANDAGIEIAVYSELDSTPTDDYYKKEIIIDWEGWRMFEIPLHEFSVTREPVGWDKIDYVKIASSGWGHTPVESTELIFDEMKLSNVRMGPKLSIDLPANSERPSLMLNSAEIAEIKTKIEQYPWAKSAYQSLQARADSLIDVAITVPETGGGFYHAQDDAAYAITERHYELADKARDLGLMYQFTGDASYMEKAKEILLAYADIYTSYEIIDKNGRTGDQASAGGRATVQGINEARWIIPLAWAYDLIYNEMSEAERTAIADGLLRPAADLIMLNNEGRHNHQTWYNAGVGVVGFALGDKEYIWYALLKDDSSLGYQLDKSVTSDGMWYEGSMHYQLYVLRALLPLMEATHHAGFNVYENPQYKALFDFMVTYAGPSLTMPTINDGRVVNLTDSDRATYYELAYRRLGDPTYVPILAQSARTDLNALLYGVGELGDSANPAWQTEHYRDSNLAVLRSGKEDGGIQATFNYMGYQGGHSHADQLALVLYGMGTPLAPDAGSIKYRLPEQEGYFKTTLAHNALVVDGSSQERAGAAQLTTFVAADTAQIASAMSSELYPGVTLQRTLLLNDDYLIDLYAATSDDVHTYDWVYHNKGSLAPPSDAFESLDKVSGIDGYDYLSNAQSAQLDGDLQAEWQLVEDKEGKHVQLWMLGEPGTTYFTANGPIAARRGDEIAAEPVPLLISRREGVTETQFVSLIQPYGESADPLQISHVATDSPNVRALQIQRHTATDLLILDEQFNTKKIDNLQLTGTWAWISQVDGTLQSAYTNGTSLAGNGWRIAQEDLRGDDMPDGMETYLEVGDDGSLTIFNSYELVSFIILEGFMNRATEITEFSADGEREMWTEINENGVVKFLAQPGASYRLIGE